MRRALRATEPSDRDLARAAHDTGGHEGGRRRYAARIWSGDWGSPKGWRGPRGRIGSGQLRPIHGDEHRRIGDPGGFRGARRERVLDAGGKFGLCTGPPNQRAHQRGVRVGVIFTGWRPHSTQANVVMCRLRHDRLRRRVCTLLVCQVLVREVLVHQGMRERHGGSS